MSKREQLNQRLVPCHLKWQGKALWIRPGVPFLKNFPRNLQRTPSIFHLIYYCQYLLMQGSPKGAQQRGFTCRIFFLPLQPGTQKARQMALLPFIWLHRWCLLTDSNAAVPWPCLPPDSLAHLANMSLPRDYLAVDLQKILNKMHFWNTDSICQLKSKPGIWLFISLREECWATKWSYWHEVSSMLLHRQAWTVWAVHPWFVAMFSG
jgi:hypothetical protein